jgi:hypothetical protein
VPVINWIVDTHFLVFIAMPPAGGIFAVQNHLLSLPGMRGDGPKEDEWQRG